MNSPLTHHEQTSDAHDERCDSWVGWLRVEGRHFVLHLGEGKRLSNFGLSVLVPCLGLDIDTVSFSTIAFALWIGVPSQVSIEWSR